MDIKIITDDLKFKMRVSGIIIKNNKLLTEKYSDDKYCLPGGYVNLGETTDKAILREIKEEMNVDVKIDEYLGVVENFFNSIRIGKTHGIDFYYKLKTLESLPNEDFEKFEVDDGIEITHKYKWINIEDLNNYNLVPNIIKEKIINNNKNFHEIVID